MAHVIDSAKAEAVREENKAREWNHQVAERANWEARHASMVEGKNSINNSDAQLGRRLTTSHFMSKLRRINPDFFLEPHPLGVNCPQPNVKKYFQTKAVLYLTLPDGTRETIMPMENDWMPEWSIMSSTEVQKPDPGGSTAWVKSKVPKNEIKRGWRTVLIRLLIKGLVNITAVEREFTPGDRLSWQVLTGKAGGMLPI